MTVSALTACILLVAALTPSGGSAQDVATAKRAIQARIDQSVEGTRTKNIALYMSTVPQDWRMRDAHGAVVTRDDLKRSQLQQWSIIDKTISIWSKIDRLKLHGGVATVWTSQRWERLMHERTGSKLDRVVTTQKHEETWRFTGGKWWCYGIKELGGSIYVNGKPYKERSGS
jgi:hypothetical protein